jgi:hypothetical protein
MKEVTFEDIWDKLNNEQRKRINRCSKPRGRLGSSYYRGKDIRLNTWNRLSIGSLDDEIWRLIPPEHQKKDDC